MKVIGLTGGIGSGKSTVARFLRELGAEVIDTDIVGHEAFTPESETWRQVVAAFGKGIMKPGGEIDRPKLGEVVFADKEALARLDCIVHPFIYRAVKDRLDRYKELGVRVVVLEVPILVELEPIKPALADEVDEVWVTVAPEVAVIKRLKAKGLPEDHARARIRTQLPASRRTPRANVVIDTDCTLEELRDRVKTLWKERALDIKTS